MSNPKEFLEQLEQRDKAADQPAPRRNSRMMNFFSMGNSGTGFQGAKRDRLTEDWNPQALSPYALHRMDSDLLRRRARDLTINNPLAKSGISAYLANVIEGGITPKPKFDDEDRRKQWINAWDHWGAHEADITGNQHIYELMTLWLNEVIEAGGCLIRKRVLPKRGRRNRAAIELIPEERFCEDGDTFTLMRNRRKSTNPISRGIEIDSATGRTVAYWIKPIEPNDVSAGGDQFDPIRIPAEECHYGFFRKRIGQVRGDTMLAPIVQLLWKLGYYTDNELMSSAIKSCFSALIISDGPGDWPVLDDAESGTGSTTDAYGNALEKLQPAMIARLQPGEDIKGVGPNIPSGDSTPWISLIQRTISVGIDLSYEEMVRDYSKGNFSSTRASSNADRKRFRPMQKFCINHFCNPVYDHWARWAVMAGTDGFPTQVSFAAAADEWLAVAWRPPGWLSVNPRDDALAADIRLKNRTQTREDIFASEGKDWEEKFEQMGKEEAKAESVGIELDAQTAMAERQLEQQGEQFDATRNSNTSNSNGDE